MTQLTQQKTFRSLRCSRCGKRLNKRTVEYRRRQYALGYSEMLPVCHTCNHEEGVKLA